jgi:hypothetical protein
MQDFMAIKIRSIKLFKCFELEEKRIIVCYLIAILHVPFSSDLMIHSRIAITCIPLHSLKKSKNTLLKISFTQPSAFSPGFTARRCAALRSPHPARAQGGNRRCVESAMWGIVTGSACLPAGERCASGDFEAARVMRDGVRRALRCRLPEVGLSADETENRQFHAIKI